jgi:hypothetical protein
VAQLDIADHCSFWHFPKGLDVTDLRGDFRSEEELLPNRNSFWGGDVDFSGSFHFQ